MSDGLKETNILTDSDKLYLYNLYYEDFKQFHYLHLWNFQKNTKTLVMDIIIH